MRSTWVASVLQWIFLALSTFISISTFTEAVIPLSETRKSDVEQKIQRNDPSAVPEHSVLEISFPQLKFLNGSSELNEGIEINSRNGKRISFGKRSVRAYPSSSRFMSSQTGGGNPYNTRSYSRFDRLDNRRNSFESADGGASTSSWGGKWFNQLKRRTNMMMSPMNSYDRQQMYQNQGTAEEPEMAATFLSGGGGGWGQSGHYGKGVNKSAVGLLGFLSLLSLIQNVLNQTSAMQGRRKRDVNWDDYDEDDNWNGLTTEITQLTPYLLPLANAVTQTQKGRLSAECTLQPICMTNQILVEKLGKERGTLAGQVMSEAVSKAIRKAECSWNKTSSLDKMETNGAIGAGLSGREGKNCKEIYRNCTTKITRMPQYYSKGESIGVLSKL